MNTIVDFLNYFFSFNPDATFSNQWIYWLLISISTLLAFYLVYLRKQNKTSKELKKVLNQALPKPTFANQYFDHAVHFPAHQQCTGILHENTSLSF
jgi:hypothetical protein